MEIITAYIRENSPAKDLEITEPPFARKTPRSDIQTAITVLGRRSEKQKKFERDQKFRIDLRNTDLSGADFSNGDFSAAMFHRSRLEAAIFSRCKLDGTQFYASLLNFADFFKSGLRGTIFDFAIINRPLIDAGAMSESLTMADSYGICVAGADISAINYLGKLRIHPEFSAQEIPSFTATWNLAEKKLEI